MKRPVGRFGLVFRWSLVLIVLVFTATFFGIARLSSSGQRTACQEFAPLNTASTQKEEDEFANALPLDMDDSHCWGTARDSTWCQNWHRQQPIPAVPPPRGTKSCLWGCNSHVGVCDAFSGWCRCPAGWTGDACDQRMRRPCSQKYRQHGFLPHEEPIDWEEEWALTLRCSGACDDDIGMCFCNSTSTYGRIPADPLQPPNTPPQRRGRPLGHDCQPNQRPDTGEPTPFGDMPLEELYGAAGWCTADYPETICPCYLDGMLGEFCDIPAEHFCANQCSGHGECYLGWCACHKGFFGHDCAYRLPGVEWAVAGEEESLIESRPWLADHVRTPAGEDPEPGATRLRPLIYVYELPPMYNQLMLQYRFDRESCTHRLFEEENVTRFLNEWGYTTETGFHEMLLQSKHRTLDPEEADFFYIPVYMSCYFWPVFGAADFPWFHGGPVDQLRPAQGTNMYLEAWSWLRSHYPYWDRHGGEDHIVLMTHDEGSCYLPAVLRNATLLTHWGRKDLGHKSGSAYDPDRYSDEVYHPLWQRERHLNKLGKYPCYNPEKDLVIPAMYSPHKYMHSSLYGAPAPNSRDILAFFRGDLRADDKRMIYSRGIRQNLAKYAQKENWWKEYKIWVGNGSSMPPDAPYSTYKYSQALASANFCFVLPGDGWSARFEDAVLHGCIPVIIQDEVDLPFESILDYAQFSIRIAEADASKAPKILKSVAEEEVLRLQQGVVKMQHRFWYGSYVPYARAEMEIKEDWAARRRKEEGEIRNSDGEEEEEEEEPDERRRRSLLKSDKKRYKKVFEDTILDAEDRGSVEDVVAGRLDDAFHTIMAWLAEKRRVRLQRQLD